MFSGCALLEHINFGNFDTSNVFAVGDSAGGHLLTLYTDAITNKYENEEKKLNKKSTEAATLALLWEFLRLSLNVPPKILHLLWLNQTTLKTILNYD